MPPSKPNILILMPDQMRADCMSAAGHPLIRTPNMDRLCAEGVRFPNAVTTCPLCMPARASFVNGLYSHNHNMWSNLGRMPAQDETFFQILQKHGYYTAHIGKSHYYEHAGKHMRLEEPYMRERGFDFVHETTGPWATVRTPSYMTDEWDRHGLYDAFKQDYAKRKQQGDCSVWPSPLPVGLFLDSYIGAQAEKFVRTCDTNKPFCLFAGFGGPHEPWDAPGEYAEMYRPEDTPPYIPAELLHDWLTDAARERAVHGRVQHMSGEDIRKIRGNYYGKISLIDHWFGRIIADCEERGFWKDLLVVFWSDHGEMLGDHGRLHKNVFYESSILFPFVFRWPGRIPQGTISEALVQQIDAFPTLLEITGAEPSTRCQGRSLLPILNGTSTSVREAALSEHANMGVNDRNYMIRTLTHKYAVDRQGRGSLLFDLEKDPHEQVNLVGRKNARKLEADMREKLFLTLADTQPNMVDDLGWKT